MSTPSPSLLAPLPASELAALASASELPAGLRNRVVASFEGRPEVLAELWAKAAAVPAKMSTRDPFVNALRRLCWPDMRVSPLHRLALATVIEPLGMLHLVAEEARTSAFRHLDESGLEVFRDWLAEWIRKNTRTERMTQIELRVSGAHMFLSVYTDLIGGRSAEFQQAKGAPQLKEEISGLFEGRGMGPARRAVAEPDPVVRPRQEGRLAAAGVFSEEAVAAMWGRVGLEGVFGLMLTMTAMGTPMNLDRLQNVEPVSDDLVLLELSRSWLHWLGSQDTEAAHFHLQKALAALDEDGDPWLELLVRLNVAVVYMGEVQDETPGFKARLEKMSKEGLFFVAYGDPFTGVFLEYQVDCRLQEAAFRPALDHLMAAEPLLREFATPGMLVVYLQLRAKLLVAKDPVRSFEDLLDAIVAARELDDEGAEAQSMMAEAMLYKAGLSRIAKDDPRTQGMLKRYETEVSEELMQKVSLYEGLSGPPGPQKKARKRQKPESESLN